MKYDVILADPPWQYNDRSLNMGGAERHYKTLATMDICKLQIPEAKILFLWATWPLIEEAFKVIDAWGYTYKTLAWEWVKFNSNSMGIYIGMGHYTRSNAEPCLLAFKNSGIPVADKSVSNVLMAPVSKHSQKPEAQYQRIERLYPNMTYIELFARHKRDGWQVWGNEIESDIELNWSIR
jgi:site-specific DNA-methyltransferase (adenine-specific)